MDRRRILGTGLIVALLLAAAWWAWPMEEAAPQPEPSPEAPAAAPLSFEVPPATPNLPATASASNGPSLPPPPEPEPVQVWCDVPGVEDTTGARWAWARWGPPVPVTAGSQGVVVQLPSERARFSGSIAVPGYVPMRATVTAGGCTIAAPKAAAYVSGRVEVADPSELADTRLYGCGGVHDVDGSGSFYLEVPAEGCTLQARRRDGVFWQRSAIVDIDPYGPGEDIVLDLDVPPFEAGGVGVMVEERSGGVGISRVLPDTPGAAAGLQAGDLVTAVDGIPTDDLDLDAYIGLAVGDAGTDVTYTVDRGGETVELTITREAMGRPE